MRIATKIVPDNCDIVLHGDNHEGLKAYHDKAVDKMLNWIMRAKNRFFIHMGDEIEARTVDHPYYSEPETKLSVPQRQTNFIIKQYEKAADRGLAWVYGNHPWMLQRVSNFTEQVCEKFKIPFMGCEGRLILNRKNGKQICRVFLGHPFRLFLGSKVDPPERARINNAIKLKRELKHKAADCLVMAVGHTHRLLVQPPTSHLLITCDNGDLQQSYTGQGDGSARIIHPDERWYASCGSFLRSQMMDCDTYSERLGYDPIELGYVVMEIRDAKVKQLREVRV